MNKEDNPFYTLASQLKQSDKIQPFNLGTIISVSPLMVSCNGLPLDRSDLLINKRLLLENNFKKGSTVVLLTEDYQKYALICEVV